MIVDRTKLEVNDVAIHHDGIMRMDRVEERWIAASKWRDGGWHFSLNLVGPGHEDYPTYRRKMSWPTARKCEELIEEGAMTHAQFQKQIEAGKVADVGHLKLKLEVA